jgi:Uma2 family endonuclease
MRTAPVKTQISFEEYLDFEETSLERHEFVDGNLFIMAGGTARHALLKDAVQRLCYNAVLECGCALFTSDASLKTPSGIGYYPDVLFTCEPFSGKTRVFTAPCILVEVLSESTEHIDRGEKWQQYQTISSLEQYVLLSQDEPKAEVFSRNSDGSWRYELFSGTQHLPFPSIKFTLPLEELYRNFPAL